MFKKVKVIVTSVSKLVESRVLLSNFDSYVCAYLIDHDNFEAI